MPHRPQSADAGRPNPYARAPCAPKTCCGRPPPGSIARPATSISTRRGRSPRALITHGHSDHARAGHGAVLATPRNAEDHGGALWRGFRRHDPGGGLWRDADDRRRDVQLPSCRPRARLGADRGETGGLRIVASGDYKRRADPTCAPLRAGALRRLHHRGDLRPARLPPSRRRGRDRQAAGIRRAVPGARASGRRLFARQGAAGDPHAARRRLRAHRSISTARWRRCAACTRTWASRSAPWRRRPWPRGKKARIRRGHRPLPALARSPSAGRGAFPIRSPASPPAGCASASAPRQAASNCRWSSPTTPTGTN